MQISTMAHDDPKWSIPSIQVYIYPIYLKLKENRSTQENMFTKFWHSETWRFFRIHYRSPILAIFLE